MNYTFYKCCAVPMCKSTTIKTPDKLFVYLPRKKQIREQWLTLAGRDPVSLKEKSDSYFCEDHFDLQNDMENYLEYTMGYVSKKRMRPGCIPTKFDCQPNRDNISSDFCLPTNTKRPRLETLIVEFEKELDKSIAEIEKPRNSENICIDVTRGPSSELTDTRTCLQMPVKDLKNYFKHKLMQDEPVFKPTAKLRNIDLLISQEAKDKEFSDSELESLLKDKSSFGRKRKFGETVSTNSIPSTSMSTKKTMALTAAERAKRYREKLKQNPDKYKAQIKKSLERLKKLQKTITELTEEEKIKRRELWRQQKRRQKQNKLQIEPSTSNDIPNMKCKTMALTVAERAKRYREKVKQNLEKYEALKNKSLERIKKNRKKITELTEKEKVKMRELWRQQKRKRRQKQNKIQIELSTSNAIPNVKTQPEAEVKIEPDYCPAYNSLCKTKAFTAAERAKRYREKVKQNLEKYEALKNKSLERIKKNQKKITELTEEEKIKKRELGRQQKRKRRQKQNKMQIELTTSKDIPNAKPQPEAEVKIELKPDYCPAYNNLCKTKAFTAAERAKRYREKVKQNPEKYKAQRKKSLERLKKNQKKITELTEEEKIKQRKLWRQQKHKQKRVQKQNKMQIEPPTSNDIPNVKPQPEAKVKIKPDYFPAYNNLCSPVRDEDACDDDSDATTSVADDEDMVEVKAEPADEEYTSSDPLAPTNPGLFSEPPCLQTTWPAPVVAENVPVIKGETVDPDLALEDYKALYFKMKEEVTRLKADNERIVNDNRTLKASNISLIDANRSLKTQTQKLKIVDGNRILQADFLKIVNENQILKERNLAIVEDNRSLNVSVVQLGKEKETLNANNISLVDKNRYLQANNLSLLKENQSLNENIQRLIEQNQSLNANNQMLVEENQNLKKKNLSLVNETRYLKANNLSFLKENQSLNANNQRLVKENQNLKTNNQQLVEENQSLNANNEQLVEGNQKLNAKNGILTERIENLLRSSESTQIIKDERVV